MKIYAKLAEIEKEVATMRHSYSIVNKRYSQTLISMKLLIISTVEAAIRVATAAEKAASAC